ncbi:MAG: hypothetical protein IJY93_09850 [Clostridia bacterium]|nr:hypothetical protein [Clostridia bacterium]
MNRNNNDEVTLYKIAAFAVFIIIAVLIVMIIGASIVGTNVKTESSDSAIVNTPTVPTPIDTSELIDFEETPDTTDSEVTTLPPETTKAPETTAPPTPSNPNEPTVAVPSKNVSAEWAETLAKYPDTVLGVTADAGKAYIDKMVFLGDSTTNGLRAYGMLNGGKNTTQVWTPKSGTLTLSNVSFETIVYPETGEQITIEEAVSRKKPEYLVITLGVNGVSFMGEDYFKAEYKGMLETIMKASPETKIICQSIFPVARSYPHIKSINNEKIRAANEWILEVADEVGVKFIDTYSVLCDSEGWLPESYHNGDGIHLHTESFTLELNNLRTHAYTD